MTFMPTRDGKFDIYSMDRKGDNIFTLTNHLELDYFASYTESGSSPYFYSKKEGNIEIYSMDAKGQNKLNVTKHPADDYLAQISPDGKQIHLKTFEKRRLTLHPKRDETLT